MDKKSFSLICAIVTSVLWGSAFVAQDMGMDFIGPHTFNVGRFLIGFLTLLPFFFIFEFKKVKEKKVNNKIVVNPNMGEEIKKLGGEILEMTEIEEKKWVRETDDKAFQNVVGMLKKKYGESSIITKDSPKPKAQPQPKRKPEKDTRSAAQREVDAQYGRTPWNKKGSLGT